MPSTPSRILPLLSICSTCRISPTPVTLTPTEGEKLYTALQDHLKTLKPSCHLQAVKCLGVCNTGCSASISMRGKWSYLLGRLKVSLAEDLLTYADLYAHSKTGLVLPSKRPASLKDMVLGRIPPYPPEEKTPDYFTS
ncbi:DUF1636 domain-containing protein [Entomobacter blattae]|uniref:Metal-binding protein n=1 Tax=Entomobacter blattae TaxID=2762277 RepID=A0A7H1NQ30_9PROT|nr:DUF1636 domain-containing protein [Entomobacter blattae]QNT77890.1 hypothetical protein JGUZn3_06480 [Entomobacter blattae]